MRIASFILIAVFGFVHWFPLFTEIFAQRQRNLCELCDCLPNVSQPNYISCNCKKEKVLLLKDEDNEILQQTQSFNISGCNFISFPPAGFPKVKKLRTLEVKMMKLLHLNSSVFPSLNSLVIEDVNELVLYGFQGQNFLANIEIRRSSIAEIMQDTFKTVKNLARLSFTDTAIKTVMSHSINLPFVALRSLIQFVNCKIDEIQMNGISAHVHVLEMTNTSINKIDSQGIVLNATGNIDIIGCKFRAFLQPDSMKLRAPSITIADSEFASLPNKLLTEVNVIQAHDRSSHIKKLNFVSNLIHDIDLGGFLLNSKSDMLNFSMNKIVCDCSSRKTSILRLNEIFPGLLPDESYFDQTIEKNYCENFGGIRLSEFKRELLNGSTCNSQSENNPISKDNDDVTHNSTQTSNTTSTVNDRKGGASSTKLSLIELIIMYSVALSVIIYSTRM